MTKAQRFFYLGPQSDAPHPTNSQDYRYSSVDSEGVFMIWEFSRREFPELFDIDDHPEKYATPASLRPKDR